MIKQILGVITGYAIFVISSVLLFRLSGVKPHVEASVAFMFLTFIYGTAFSFLSGLVTQIIAKTKNLKVNFILFIIMAGFATFSLFKSDGSSWTQLLAIFVFFSNFDFRRIVYNQKKQYNLTSPDSSENPYKPGFGL